MVRAWFAAALSLVACGKSTMQPSGPDAASTGSDAPSADAAGPGWTTLISRTWTLDPGFEGYKCRRIQVPADLWITGFRALSPVGTHHEVLTFATSAAQTGDFECSPSTFDTQMIYAAGVNTDDLALPTGVAIHLTAGQYITLNLHVFNSGDTTLTNVESGVLVQTIPEADVVHEADMVFSGTVSSSQGGGIYIPNDGQPHVAQGGCVAPTDWHAFTVWPHMHQTGTHQRLVVTHQNTPSTLLDTDYTFTDQRNYPIAETLIHQGDTVVTTCTYVNTTAINPMTYGDSTDAEMCFTGLYKYPAGSTYGGTLYDCVSN